MAKRPSTKRRKGIGIHIGLNSLDPDHYEGWTGDLAACEFDARDMAAIARTAGMKSTVILTRKATRNRCLAAVRAAAKELNSGDLLFLTYSGHGGQIKDVTGEADEKDKRDETWCLWDGQIIDDEIFVELCRFKAGVRILVLSYSCHSGTVTRAALRNAVSLQPGRSKMMPPAVANRTYNAHKEFYDGIQHRVAAEAGKKSKVDPDAMLAHVTVSNRLTSISAQIKASVLLISGCQDNQTSLDGDQNGAFTEQLLAVWDDGAFQGNYAKFHAAIKAGLPPTQSPNLFTLGPSAAFAAQRPFTV
jgi:hypothetical protein